MRPPTNLNEPSAHALAAGDLEAVFLPGKGMLGASLRHAGVEMLGRVEDLAAAAAKGGTAGLPLLHPWANRLAGLRYRAAGRDVVLDPQSTLLHFDANGLPIHGVPWSLLAWEVTEARRDFLAARLDWSRSDLLAVFPYPHRLELRATLRPDALTLETILTAGPAGAGASQLRVSSLSAAARPPARAVAAVAAADAQLVLDRRGIPTGEEHPFDGLDAAAGHASLRRWLCGARPTRLAHA